jgi:hypothetical protein
MAGILPGAVRRNNSKLLDQVRAVSRLKHYSIRTEQAYTDWTRRFIVFHTKRNNGVWRDPREGMLARRERTNALSLFPQEFGWIDGNRS